MHAFVRNNAYGNPSIDFADPDAVRALNRALLQSQYGIAHWSLPDGYLCPPIPGRADYVHGLADLLAQDHGGVIPRGATVRALDIGTGASCIYPLIGQREYGWHFLGSETDPVALASAQSIVDANGLATEIELRLQSDRGKILSGLVRSDERFEVTLCNPPFHASAAEAAQGSERKWRNLGKPRTPSPALNFGGQRAELWCRGGEATFVRQMIDESRAFVDQVRWFTSLISKGANLPGVHQHLKRLGATRVRTLAMAQGQKQSRFVAWSFTA